MRHRVIAGLLAAGLVPVGVLILPGPANAATYTVTTTSDRPDTNLADGVCHSDTGSCSLRATLQQANQRSGPDVITLPRVRYTIGVARGVTQPSSMDPDNDYDLDITDSVTITGAG